MTMPLLPEPTGSQWLDWDDKSSTYEALYTADQMIAYGAACAAAERERCAKVCKTSLAAPQQRKQLTDDEFISLMDCDGLGPVDPCMALAIKSLVERAHDIKETP